MPRGRDLLRRVSAAALRRGPGRRARAAGLALALFAGLAAQAHATSIVLIDSTTHRGYIGLYAVTTTDVHDVVLSERIDGRLYEVARPQMGFFENHPEYGPINTGQVLDVARWECDRRTRTFVISGVGKDGPERELQVIRTPSCSNRLELSVKPGRATVTDTWDSGGIDASLCTPKRCVPVSLPQGRARVTRRLPIRKGDELTLYGPGQRVTQAVGAKSRGGAVILTTGDSMMQSLDAILQEQLDRTGKADVRSDVHVGSALSNNFVVDFRALARRQVKQFHPRSVIVFLGSNDQAAMSQGGKRIPCCGLEWSAVYETRVRTVMKTYLQGGAGSVVWVTVPIARDERRTEAILAVNAALRRAAADLPGVQLVEADRIFTPDGQFHRNVIWNGRELQAREDDGIHLTVEGARIAAQFVTAALRKLHVL